MTASSQSAGTTAQCEVLLMPRGSEWRGLMQRAAQSRLADPRAQTFRRELGLPDRGAVVMSGHQAQFWHPGILAKYFAGDALASASGDEATFAWLVVEQDTNDPGAVRLPVRRAADSGARALRVENWSIDARSRAMEPDVAVGGLAPVRPAPPPTLGPGEVWAAPGIAAGIAAIHAALSRRVGEATASVQWGEAVLDVLEPMSHRRARLVRSLVMSRTSLFAEVVGRMRSDPAACIAAYNRAVGDHPHERVQALAADELPAWVLERSGGVMRRRRATIADLSRPVEELAPRALLMTGLLRWAACDLFIHGTGGGGAAGGGHAGYDRITEQWFHEWLGSSGGLAPSVVATATLRLNMGHDGPRPDELRRSQWLAHRARHEPALLNDPAADARKRALVREIRNIKRAGGDARPVYRRMHAILEESRQAHAARLVELKLAAESAASRLGDAEIAADRTWAFPLYEAEQLSELRDQIRREIG